MSNDVTRATNEALLREWCHLPAGAPRERLLALGDRLHDMLQALAKATLCGEAG